MLYAGGTFSCRVTAIVFSEVLKINSIFILSTQAMFEKRNSDHEN